MSRCRNLGSYLYLYEDMAPTISVVAETPSGFPYSGEPRYVKRPQDIMQLYIGRSWRKRFSSEPWPIASRRIVNAIERNAGSIAKPSADALKLKVSALRIMMEQMGLEDEVNAIRKRFNRRPAKFRPEDLSQAPYHLYELRLPAGFR